MILITDFDYTLFNTHLFVNAFKDVFFTYAIKSDDWKTTYDQVMLWTGGEMGYDYSFERHVDALIELGYDVPREQIIQELYDCVSDKFLYDDVHDFLSSMSKIFNNRMLLTAGNRDFQRKKVEGVGVNTYFTDAIYINGDKHKYVKETLQDGENIIFINDNLKENIAVKKAVPHAHVITKFNQRRNTIEELRESTLPYFETLTAIQEYVTQEFI